MLPVGFLFSRTRRLHRKIEPPAVKVHRQFIIIKATDPRCAPAVETPSAEAAAEDASDEGVPIEVVPYEETPSEVAAQP
jgi:hypothetical protein